jgi:hypothetical protein
MSFPPELLALGVILIFAILIIWMIRTSRREQTETDYQLSQLGFEALEAPPPELEQRVAELYQTSKGREVRLWRVFHRREMDQDLYLFNAEDTRGESSEIGSGVFGIKSNRLALPRFSMVTLPDFDRSSLIGNLMDKLLDKVMSFAEGYLGLEQVDLCDRPDLDDQVILFARDQYAVKDMLDRVGSYLIRSVEMPIQIAGRGDFLTVDFSTSTNLNQSGQDLASRYQTFIQISRAFMD